MNLCASGESEELQERDGGFYSCADGSWFVKNSKCCECCPVPLQRAESTRPFDAGTELMAGPSVRRSTSRASKLRRTEAVCGLDGRRSHVMHAPSNFCSETRRCESLVCPTGPDPVFVPLLCPPPARALTQIRRRPERGHRRPAGAADTSFGCQQSVCGHPDRVRQRFKGG